MKVVIINAHIHDRIGGSELQCDLIAKGLTARGHEVHYLAVGSNECGRHDSEYAIHPVAHSSGDIGKRCLEVAPDVVYWRYNKHCFYGAAKAISEREIPIVFAVSAVADMEKWGDSGIARRRAGIRGWGKVVKSMVRSRWNHRGFSFVSALTVNNPEHLNRLPLAKQRYVPNGMINDLASFGWDRKYIAWVGNIKPGKRPEKFVQLAGVLASQGIDCLMIGRIDDTKYEWLRHGEGCPANFHYLGVKSPLEVNGILAGAALHVHTCIPEGFSNVFIQAWLQSCPSVSLDFDPGGYIASEGLGAFAAGDWDRFVEQVRLLLSDDAKRHAVGQSARAFAQSAFSVDRLIDQVDSILYEVVADASVERNDS